MTYSPDNALIIQSDRTVLLDVCALQVEAAQAAIATRLSVGVQGCLRRVIGSVSPQVLG